ncbi:MAG: HAD hydrolase family protein [Candidatus Marinimicrobia bacterium]|nr:HAD hydrolase family protein [Candidatus Neomarinimicrobiota bacterium]
MDKNALTECLLKIKLVISDVDGVFTDGSLYIGHNGEEFKRFNVLDGAGIALMKAVEIPMAIISGRKSGVTLHRMKELGLDEHLYQGNLAKIEPYLKIKADFDLNDAEILYIGDDLVDIPLIRRAGVGVAVANAAQIVKNAADYVTHVRGGHGAVREVIELLLNAQDKFAMALEKLTKHTYKDN